MPIVRIDLPAGQPDDYAAAVGDVVHQAMVDILNVPRDDRFQVIAGHAPARLVIDPTYLGIARGPDALIIQITLNNGRGVELKKSFYKAVAEGLRARVGLRPEDVLINLVEVPKENWSFGNGEMQYA